MKGEPGRRRGRLPTFLLRSFLVLLLLALAGVAVVRLLPADRYLLERAGTLVLESTGGQLSAGRAAVSWLEGRIELVEARWGVAGSPPLATARRVVVEVDPTSLSSRPFLRSVEVEGLTIDLRSPLPKAPGTDAGPVSLDLPVDIARLEVRGLEVIGRLPERLAEKLSGRELRLRRGRLTGSSEAGRSRLLLTLPELRAGALRFQGSLRAWNEGETKLALETRLSGEGLALRGAGDVGVSGPRNVALSLDLTGELGPVAARLAPGAGLTGALLSGVQVSGSLERPAAAATLSVQGLRSRFGAVDRVQLEARADRERVEVSTLTADLEGGGRILARGRHELEGGATEASLEAEGVPAAVLSPWLDERSRKRVEGTALDLTASARSGAATWSALAGTAEITLREERRPLLTARAHAKPDARAGAVLSLEASLLPLASGRRTLEASLEAPDLSRLAEARIARGEAILETADLEGLLADLARRLPELARVPAALRSGRVAARARLSGPLDRPRAELDATWGRPDGSEVKVRASGPARLTGPVTIAAEVARLRLGPLDASLAGSLDGRLSFEGLLPLDGRLSRRRPFVASVRLDATGLEAGGQRVESAHLAAHGTEREVIVDELRAESLGRRVTVTGRLDPARPLGDAAFEVTLGSPAAHVASASLPVTLSDGTLEVTGGSLETEAGTLLVGLELPLGALRRVKALEGKLGFLPGGLPEGRVSVTAFAPLLDSAPLTPAGEERPTVCTGLSGSLDVDLARPLDSTGTLRLPGLFLGSGLASLYAASPVELTLEGGVLTLAPLTLAGEAGALAVGGSFRLTAPSEVDASVAGDVSASLLSPFLAGGLAAGRLHVRGEASGRPADLQGRLRIAGKTASVFWPSPYATKLSAPDLEVTFGGGVARVESGSLRLNGGEVSLTGSYDTGHGLSLAAAAKDVRYVLAYGLRATFDGWLSLTLPPEGKGDRELVGSLTMDHGVLDRDVDLDREILSRFLAPPESAGSGTGVLSTIALDLTVDTTTGVRVRNNLADLKARWGTLTLGGTLQEPVLVGRIDVEKGGRLFAYQQTFRIESCSLTYTGDPGTDPRIDAVTTSSLQDPSVAPRDAGPPSFTRPREKRVEYGEGESAAASAVAYGLAGYYGERVTSRLGQALGITIRPILIFNEADPGARLTVQRELNRNVSLAFSLNLTNAQEQTYILDLHGLRGLPTMTLQAFTNDEGLWGGTLQQSFDLLGPRPSGAAEPELRELRVSTGEPSLDRRLERRLGLRRGDPVGRSRLFDLEVDAERILREAGRPDAVVSAASVPVAGKRARVDVTLTAEPGPPARVVFEGDTPPSLSRAGIAALYRGEPFEEGALEEMRARTVRVFQSLFHLRPEVTASVEAEASGGRLVRVRTRAGEVTPVEELRVTGLPPDEAKVAEARFRGALERVELALSEPAADRRLRAALASLGYARARILERALAEGVLTVRVEPGGRSRVGTVRVEGLDALEPAPESVRLPLSPGDPLRSDRLAEGTLLLTRALHRSGRPDARVRAVLSGAEGDEVRDVAFRVEPGPPFRVGSVDFEGLRGTSRSFVSRVAGLKAGQPLVADEVDAARSRLVETGLFTAVRGEARREEGGRARVVFSLTPAPRYKLSYGLRFENTVGLGGVVDLVDHSFLGRGITLGLRGFYDREQQGGRVFAGAKDVLGSRFALDAFAQRSRETSEGSNLRVDSFDATLQVSRSLSSRLSARVYGRWHRETISEITPDPFFPVDPIRITNPHLGLQAVYDSREDALTSDRGLFASVDLSGSGEVLGSDFSYLRAFGQVNVYQPLGRVLGVTLGWAQSVRVGLARAFADQELVRSARFFAGGEYSLRGYGRNNVGPREDLGGEVFPAGGEALLVVNEELRVPVFSRVMGVLFFDTGNVWETTNGFGSGLKSSFGLGVRVLTPVGILRVDGARPLSPRDGDPSFKVYLGFGSVF